MLKKNKLITISQIIIVLLIIFIFIYLYKKHYEKFSLDFYDTANDAVDYLGNECPIYEDEDSNKYRKVFLCYKSPEDKIYIVQYRYGLNQFLLPDDNVGELVLRNIDNIDDSDDSDNEIRNFHNLAFLAKFPDNDNTNTKKITLLPNIIDNIFNKNFQKFSIITNFENCSFYSVCYNNSKVPRDNCDAMYYIMNTSKNLTLYVDMPSSRTSGSDNYEGRKVNWTTEFKPHENKVFFLKCYYCNPQEDIDKSKFGLNYYLDLGTYEEGLKCIKKEDFKINRKYQHSDVEFCSSFSEEANFALINYMLNNISFTEKEKDTLFQTYINRFKSCRNVPLDEKCSLYNLNFATEEDYENSYRLELENNSSLKSQLDIQTKEFDAFRNSGLNDALREFNYEQLIEDLKEQIIRSDQMLICYKDL